MRLCFLSVRRSPAARPLPLAGRLLVARRLRPRGGRGVRGRRRWRGGRSGRRAPVHGHGRVRLRLRLPWRLLLRRLRPLRGPRPRCPLFRRALRGTGPVLLGSLRLLGLLGRRRRLLGRRCGHGRPRQEGLGYRVLREGARRRRSTGRGGGPLRTRVARPGRVGAGGLVRPRRLDGVGRRRKRSLSRIARRAAGRGALAVSGRFGEPAAGRGWLGAAGPTLLAIRVLGTARKALAGGGLLRPAGSALRTTGILPAWRGLRTTRRSVGAPLLAVRVRRSPTRVRRVREGPLAAGRLAPPRFRPPCGVLTGGGLRSARDGAPSREALTGGGPLRPARRRVAPPLPGVVAAGRRGLAVHRPGVPSRFPPRRLPPTSLVGIPVHGNPRLPAGRVPGVRRRVRVPPAVVLLPGLLLPGRGPPFRFGSLLHGYSPPSTRVRTGPAPSTERSSASAATS
ncbi:Uncharacterised protein [Nocardiopsis dassonvillei]|uniref:PE-PGRS family protein n=1 Tax=Nocardiopsis dassonvillei (strain ATCC 23218 / DSM 43111 / CIP 107115 / JCM 7437 / KCTC 9190 / NBRC 14626 / NCTC 10488 / NRRL B-5397 / IMRU 509) TaxID=446468 RepID=D7AZ21_NOCDD|nr:PE-PGRS family protein [Nocardiopsis dassonvillei subsp. dassonvillei DSM 43111]VEI90515.1 Uncharacterised protein [Nocardiopsis dassonvillei]